MRGGPLALLILLGVVAGGAGCEEPPRAVERPAAPAAAVRTQVVAALGDAVPIAAAELPGGTVYWSQVDADGRGAVLRVGRDGVPVPAGLSRDRIAAALGIEPGRWPALDGRVVGLAAGRGRGGAGGGGGGEVLFFFLGALEGRDTVAVLGRLLEGEGGRLETLATTDRLAEVSGLGRSLTLADARLTGRGEDVVLWLSVPGEAVALEVDAARVPVTLRRPFRQVRDERSEPLRLTTPGTWAAALPGGGLLVTHPATSSVYRIDPPPGREAARAVRLTGTSGLPTSTRAVPIGGGEAALLVPGGDAPRPPPGVRPLTEDRPAVLTLGLDDGEVRDTFAGQTLRPVGQVAWDEMVPTLLAATPTGGLLVHDGATGRLLRVNLPRPATP